MAVGSYGLMSNTANQAFLAGVTPTMADTVNIRSGTSAGGSAIVMFSSTGPTLLGLIATNFLVDDGTIWASDVKVSGVAATLTLNSPTVSCNPAGLYAGMEVTANGVPWNTTILSVGATTITLSKNANVAAQPHSRRGPPFSWFRKATLRCSARTQPAPRPLRRCSISAPVRPAASY